MFQSILQETLAENWQEVQKLGAGISPRSSPGSYRGARSASSSGEPIFTGAAECAESSGDKLKSMGKKRNPSALLLGCESFTQNFPGTFSLRPQTMKQVLFEIFENVRDFSFHDVYCFNYHGDSYHVGAIADTMKSERKTGNFQPGLVLNELDFAAVWLAGNGRLLLIVNPEYPWSGSTGGRFGTRPPGYHPCRRFLRTAAMNYFCPELVDLKTAEKLPSTSLDQEGLQKWLQGGDVTRESVPPRLCRQSGGL